MPPEPFKPFKPKPQPVETQEEVESIEVVPANTLMRVLKRVTTIDGVVSEEILTRDVLWNKTKEDVVAEIDSRKALVEAEKTAEIAKLEAQKIELNK